MQTLAGPARGPIPNVLGNAVLGDFGTMVMRIRDRWFYYNGVKSGPPGGLTAIEFLRLFKAAPPSNVIDGHWGIVPGLMYACNWTVPQIQACLDCFVEQMQEEHMPVPAAMRKATHQRLIHKPLTMADLDAKIHLLGE